MSRSVFAVRRAERIHHRLGYAQAMQSGARDWPGSEAAKEMDPLACELLQLVGGEPFDSWFHFS